MEQEKSLTLRAQQMYALIEKYLSGELTQKQFCQHQSLPFSTFAYWLRRYRRNAQKAVQPATEFIPLTFTSTRNRPILSQPTCPDGYLLSHGACAVEYPNGVMVRLFGSVDVPLIDRLIKLQGL